MTHAQRDKWPTRKEIQQTNYWHYAPVEFTHQVYLLCQVLSGSFSEWTHVWFRFWFWIGSGVGLFTSSEIISIRWGRWSTGSHGGPAKKILRCWVMQSCMHNQWFSWCDLLVINLPTYHPRVQKISVQRTKGEVDVYIQLRAAELTWLGSTCLNSRDRWNPSEMSFNYDSVMKADNDWGTKKLLDDTQVR